MESPESKIASVGRRLAKALSDFARERRDDDRKNIAALQTELCKVVKENPDA